MFHRRRKTVVFSEHQAIKLRQSIIEGPRNSETSIYLPSVHCFLRAFNKLQATASFSYWLLLYDRIIIHLERVRDIKLLVEFIGRDNLIELSNKGRLVFSYDPQISTSYREPDSWSIQESDIDYFGIGYGGSNRDEGLSFSCGMLSTKYHDQLNDRDLSNSITRVLFPSFEEHDGELFISALHENLNKNIYNHCKGDHKLVERFVLGEMLIIRGLADATRHAAISNTLNCDLDLKGMESIISHKSIQRVDALTDLGAEITSEYVDKKKCLNETVKIAGCPNIYLSIRDKDKSLEDYIDLSNHSSGKGFREWLTTYAKSHSHNEIGHEFVDRLINLVKQEKKPNWIGWAVQNSLGVIPIAGNLAAAALGAGDNFRKEFSGTWKPMIFVDEMTKIHTASPNRKVNKDALR